MSRRKTQIDAGGTRRGAAALDHVLVLAVALPVLAIVIPVGQRIMRAVWEMCCVQICWPFL